MATRPERNRKYRDRSCDLKRDFDQIDRSVLISLDENVREALVEYVSLFKTRGDVLYHMYFILGNGYHWIEGKLVDPWPTRLNPDPRPDSYAWLNADTGNSVMDAIKRGIALGMMERDKSERADAIEELDERAINNDWVESLKFGKRMITGGSDFFRVPDNAEPDYIQGAIDAGETAIKYLGSEGPDKQLNTLIADLDEELVFLRDLLAERTAPDC